MTIDPSSLKRFGAELDRLVAPQAKVGVAVSGGPDSLALLLLASLARPGAIHAATVDHGLRAGSRAEALEVAATCADLGISHQLLTVSVGAGASLQAQAREARYGALVRWAEQCGLAAVLTGHHADDQAETLLMRLARGSGLPGLSGIRPVQFLPTGDGGRLAIVRPLLGWRKAELRGVVDSAGLIAVDDPANRNPRHDRTHARALIASQDWLDPCRLATSAAHLAEAEEALSFAAERWFSERHRMSGDTLILDPADLPPELQRRLLLLACSALGSAAPRGPDLGRALTTLRSGRSCTLGGLQLSGGAEWRLAPAAPRRR